jgi:hypothetical protein
VVALLGALASTVWMAVLVSPTGDPSRAYLGSDSHAMGLLVGVALGASDAGAAGHRGASHSLCVAIVAGIACAAMARRLGWPVLRTMRAFDGNTYGCTTAVSAPRWAARGHGRRCCRRLAGADAECTVAAGRVASIGSTGGWRCGCSYRRAPVSTAALFVVRSAWPIVRAEPRIALPSGRFGSERWRNAAAAARLVYFAVITAVAVVLVAVAAPRFRPRSSTAAAAQRHTPSTVPRPIRALRADIRQLPAPSSASAAHTAQELHITVGGDAPGRGVVPADHESQGEVGEGVRRVAAHGGPRPARPCGGRASTAMGHPRSADDRGAW